MWEIMSKLHRAVPMTAWHTAVLPQLPIDSAAFRADVCVLTHAASRDGTIKLWDLDACETAVNLEPLSSVTAHEVCLASRLHPKIMIFA